MKISTKTLLIIFGVLAVFFVVIQMTKRDGKSKNLKTELVNIDAEKADKVVVTSPKGVVTLTKASENWEVQLPDGAKPTRENAVSNVLNTLNTIKPGRMAAKKKEKWAEYSVDSTGTRVQVYNGSEVLSDIVLGRFGVQGQQSFYTFVRLFEDSEVYVAPDFMKMSVNEDPNDYRDNKVLRLEKDSLVAVTFNYPDSAFTLTKNEKWFVGEVEADSALVVSYLQGLRSVNSKAFYEQALTGSASHTVTFAYSNQPEMTIEGFYAADGMVVKSPENAVEVFKDEKVTEKIFKGKGSFMVK